MISKSYGKPYANWLHLCAACSYAIGADRRNSVDEAVLKPILTRFTDAVDCLFLGQKISDEHVSSGDESSGSKKDAFE